MTELLQQVFAKIVQLSPEQQDAIAARLLGELAGERKWKNGEATVRQEISDEGSVDAALQELQKLCAEENYTLIVPPRQDRSNASVETNALSI